MVGGAGAGGDDDRSAVAELVAHRDGPGLLGRILVVGVAMVLAAGAVLATRDRDGSGPDPDREDDQDLPQPIALVPLGPRDGKASIGLPVTVEPSVGLVDQSHVTVTGSGFQPGERVVIVQCAIEAGRPAKGGQAAGVDGCDTTVFTYVDADQDGKARGDFSVSKTITTPVTGVTSCSTEPGRCIVAMAASSDYDRSGGSGLTFGPAVPPEPGAPTLTVEPSSGLVDAQVVHVAATGLPPSAPVELEVCSVDPAACWATGHIDSPGTALLSDAAGSFVADVPVWRYLPGPEPATYVDCAVSACNLVLSTGAAASDPTPLRLMFTPGGAGPVGADLAVDPDEEIRPGATVVVRGAGFDPGATVSLSFCIAPATGGEPDGLCVDLAAPIHPAGDGTFEAQVVVPEVAALAGDRLMGPSTTGAPPAPDTEGWPCDGSSTRCVVRGSLAFGEVPGGPLRPRFGPDPVAVTYAPAR